LLFALLSPIWVAEAEQTLNYSNGVSTRSSYAFSGQTTVVYRCEDLFDSSKSGAQSPVPFVIQIAQIRPQVVSNIGTKKNKNMVNWNNLDNRKPKID